eukprot:CAMPEP_0172837170 /NCGR_PEP_ID=MMETSP1075-20121228/26995_1 /TAXON_ID=2916 /ORGANISM="Ceratium fusus, Strain PA161109" /LENGTH=36 /DNA_ID= /DNA_START= /DNA_END= /DNA_ORIENTATION=
MPEKAPKQNMKQRWQTPSWNRNNHHKRATVGPEGNK